jgi:hypothetical protein
MPGTPFTARSIGVTTALEHTSAFAPVYFVVMVTDGGSISGYCVTGSCIKAINPRKTKRTEITIDNTGRLMKDDNMFLNY